MLDFKGLFLEKTGNEWENRKNFEKKPKLFNIIEIDYMQDHDAALCTKQVRFLWFVSISFPLVCLYKAKLL